MPGGRVLHRLGVGLSERFSQIAEARPRAQVMEKLVGLPGGEEFLFTHPAPKIGDSLL